MLYFTGFSGVRMDLHVEAVIFRLGIWAAKYL